MTKLKMTEELVKITVKVNEFFKDEKKTALWMNTLNGNLGFLAPMKLIQIGKAHKVLEFVESAVSENKLEIEE